MENVLNDVTFPGEFVLKNEAGMKRQRSSRRAEPQTGRKRVVKRQSSRKASLPKARRSDMRLSGGSLLILAFVFLLVLLLLSRLT